MYIYIYYYIYILYYVLYIYIILIYIRHFWVDMNLGVPGKLTHVQVFFPGEAGNLMTSHFGHLGHESRGISQGLVDCTAILTC